MDKPRRKEKNNSELILVYVQHIRTPTDDDTHNAFSSTIKAVGPTGQHISQKVDGLRSRNSDEHKARKIGNPYNKQI